MTDQDRDRIIVGMLNQGLSLASVQKALADEHGLKITYFDLRLLAAGLEVDWKKQDPEPVEEELDGDEELAESPPPRVQISISKLVRPGAALSGEVTFASGASAEWTVDPMGRLGLNPMNGSEQPTEEDLLEFQTELQQKLASGQM
jgi:hypothetical protein